MLSWEPPLPSRLRSASPGSLLFEPLGGHLGAWKFSLCGAAENTVVKKTTVIEGAFYFHVLSRLSLLSRLTAPHRSSVSELYLSLTNKVPEAGNPANWFDRNGQDADLLHWAALMAFLPAIRQIYVEEDAHTCFIEMDNLMPRSKPEQTGPGYCAMDLKVGTRLWGLDAPLLKRARMEAKAVVGHKACENKNSVISENYIERNRFVFDRLSML